jgi:hypothetical protein
MADFIRGGTRGLLRCARMKNFRRSLKIHGNLFASDLF